MRTISRIAPLSLAKIQAIIMAIFGVFQSVIALVSLALAPTAESAPLTIFFLPLIGGAVGFVSGLIIAWAYNLLAGWFGGVEIEIEK